MRRLAILLVPVVALAACGEGKETAAPTPAEPLGPPTYANIIAKPAAYAGQPVEFKVSLAAGQVLLPSGETVTQLDQGWVDPAGKEYSVAPPPDRPADAPCVYIVVDDNRTPVVPIQPLMVENLSPCLAGSVPPVITGVVKEVRDTQLVVNQQRTTIPAVVLGDMNFKSPF